jgi:hypothetical protein
LPARFDSSARPDNRTALGVGASQRTIVLPARHAREVVLSLPWALDSTHELPAELRPLMCISCCRRSGTARNTPLRSVLCGPCWFASGGDAAPTELVGRPAPPTSALPATAREWFRAVQQSSWYGGRRRDCARRLMLLLDVLARHANWEDHTTWPTWDRLIAATGWSRSTMSSWLADLQHHGWLLRIEGGSTPQFRPMALQHVEGNRAAVYQLRMPLAGDAATGRAGSSDDLTRTPTPPTKSLISRDQVVPTRATTFFHSPSTNPQLTATNDGPTGPRLDQKQGRFFDLRVPTSPAQMLAAATELRDADRAFRRLSSRWIRTLVARWWRAGWTNSDLLHALSHAPTVGGSRPSERCPATQMRRPDGWVRHRLSRWLDESGPMPAPRRWEATQREVVAVHGAAAAARLPYGAAELQPHDLAVTDGQRAEAATQLVRRWAREFQDRRDAPNPPELIPDRETAKRLWAETCAGIRAHRTRVVEDEPVVAPAATDVSPADEMSARSTYERALEVARAEGRVARPRRNRRRSRW